MKPENQHYLPQFYLKGFGTQKSKGLIYRLDIGNTEFKEKAVSRTGSRPEMHSRVDASGNKDRSIEDWLGDIENKAAVIIQKIVDGIDVATLTSEQQRDLAIFIVNMSTRVPSQVDHIHGEFVKLEKHKWDFERGMRMQDTRWQQFTTLPLEQAFPHLAKFIEPDWLDAFETLLRVNEPVAKVIFHMRWTFFRSTDEDYFITSDYPYFLYNENDNEDSIFGKAGLGDLASNISLPLSKEVCFYGSWDNGQRDSAHAPRDIVIGFNKRSVINATRHIISPSPIFPGNDIINGDNWKPIPKEDSCV